VKKIGSIAIALVYLALSVGIAKSTHFCMGRPLPSSVFSFESKKCVCEKSAQPDDCCDDEIEIIKIENDQFTGLVLHSPAPEFSLICELVFEPVKTVVQHSSFEFAVEHNLPPPKVPIYQKICSLVFYESVS
jgi:hypothetical protein